MITIHNKTHANLTGDVFNKKKEEKNRTEDIWMCSFIYLGETLDILEWLQQIKGNKENLLFL